MSQKIAAPKLLFLLLSAFAVGLLTYIYRLNKIEIADPRVAQIFELRDVFNNPVHQPNTEFVIINFWASWCPPCIEETPSLARFAATYSKYFTLLALSQDSSRKEILDFVRTFPSLKSSQITIIHDSSQAMARSFQANKLPETFIYSIKQNKFLGFSGSTNWDHPDVISSLRRYFNTSFD